MLRAVAAVDGNIKDDNSKIRFENTGPYMRPNERQK